MSFILPKNSGPASPPDGDARDRFGLRINFVLLEETAQMESRFAAAERFINEAAEAAIRQVGRKRAQYLFRLALREPPKGKQRNLKENELLLVAYDRALARGIPVRNAARVAAEEMITKYDDVESIARHIRRLVKERSLRKTEAEEIEKRYGETLLGKFDACSKTDI